MVYKLGILNSAQSVKRPLYRLQTYGTSDGSGGALFSGDFTGELGFRFESARWIPVDADMMIACTV